MFEQWFLELTSLISDIVVGLSALIVAVLAVIGLSQWRREIKGRTKFEVARKIAVLAFEYRDKYKRARNLFTFPGESSERVEGENETADETNLLNEYYARRRRLEPLQRTLRKLYETSWEAEIILDKDIGNLLLPFEESFGEIYASMEAYFVTKIQRLGRPPAAATADEWLDSHFYRIYGQSTDDISKSIDESTTELVDKLKTYQK